MAQAFKCDRCGNFFDIDSYDELELEDLPVIYTARKRDERPGPFSMNIQKHHYNMRDLCPGCVLDLKDWYNQLRPEEFTFNEDGSVERVSKGEYK